MITRFLRSVLYASEFKHPSAPETVPYEPLRLAVGIRKYKFIVIAIPYSAMDALCENRKVLPGMEENHSCRRNYRNDKRNPYTGNEIHKLGTETPELYKSLNLTGIVVKAGEETDIEGSMDKA